VFLKISFEENFQMKSQKCFLAIFAIFGNSQKRSSWRKPSQKKSEGIYYYYYYYYYYY
tara:strand:+ start:364 stop:537 length:174 start_codon:yes stop_codon:yes gene_type:complete